MDPGERLRQLMSGLAEMAVPDQLIDDVGEDTMREAVIANEIRRRYKPETNRNPKDGCYAAVVMCRYCNPNHEVIKSAWIFDDETEAQQYAEQMLQSYINKAIRDLS